MTTKPKDSTRKHRWSALQRHTIRTQLAALADAEARKAMKEPTSC